MGKKNDNEFNNMIETLDSVIVQLPDGTEIEASKVKMYQKFRLGGREIKLRLQNPVWRDVRESLPDEYDYVFVVISAGATYYEEVAHLENGKWISNCGNSKWTWGEDGHIEHVVAWTESPDYPDWLYNLLEEETEKWDEKYL